MRRWLAFIAGFVVLLGLVVFLAAGSQPALRFALAQAKAAGFDVDARILRGNLFLGIEAVDATVKSAFIRGSGASVRAKYNLWTLLQKRELRLEVGVSGGKLSFDPAGLPPVVEGGEPPPIHVFLDSAQVSDTVLEFVGKNIFVPDAKVTLLSQSSLPSQNGKTRGNLRVKLESKDGGGFATALYEFGKDFDPNLVIDTELDASVANYWLKPIPMDIQDGKLRGTVRVTATSLMVDAVLEKGIIEVLPNLVVSNIAGRASFDAAGLVKAKLTGQGLGGSLETDFELDTKPKQEYWKIRGKLRPRLEQIMKTFANDTPGKGALEVSVSGGGWEKLKLIGSVKSLGMLEAAGFPVENLRGTWQFTDHLEASASAVTKIGEDKLNAVAEIKSVGEKIVITPELTGNFLNAPIKLGGLIEVLGEKIGIQTTGTLLRGDVNAKINLQGEKISGTGQFKAVQLPLPKPLVSRVNGSAKLSGTVNNLVIAGLLNPARLEIPAIDLNDISGAYKLRFDGKALTAEANLADGTLVANGAIINTDGKPARGNVFVRGLRLEAGGQADYSAQYVLNSAGIALAGVARGYKLNFSQVQLDDLSGVLSVSVGQQIRGRWNANKLLATFTDKSLNLRPRDWRVRAAGETAFVNGDMILSYDQLKTSGKLEGKTRFGTITALGQGKQIALSGRAGLNGLRAALNGALQLEPFNLRLAAVPQNKLLGGKILLEADKNFRISGNLSSNGQDLQIGFTDTGLTAKGKLDLSALAPVFPVGTRDVLTGIAEIDISGSSGTGLVRGVVAGIPLEARLRSNNLRVSTEARVTAGQFVGATVTGEVFPSVNARVNYAGLLARVRGAYDNLGIVGSGTLPASLLAGTGLSLANNEFALIGRFQNNLLTASGRVGAVQVRNVKLENGVLGADFTGDLVGTYQEEPLRLRGLNGSLEQRNSRLEVRATAKSASGVFAGNSISALGVTANFNQQDKKNIIGFAASSATGTFSGVKTQVGNVSGVLNLNGNTLDLQARAASATAQTSAGLVLASGLTATSQGVLERLPIRFSATKLEATGFESKALLGQVSGTVTVAQSLSFNANFASGSVKHPEASATIGTGQVSGNLRGQQLETRFSLPNLSAAARGENAKISAKGSLGLNLEQPNKNWRGNLEATAVGQDWRLGAKGDWQNLRLTGYVPTRLSSLAGVALPMYLQTNVAINGTVGLPDLQYNLGLISKLSGLQVNASLKGQNTVFQARLEAKDAAKGKGTIVYASDGKALVALNNLDISALSQVQGSLSGQLELNQQSLRGKLTGNLAGLPMTATWLENNAFTGEIGGSIPVRIKSSKWLFPLETILELETLPSELPIRGQASFNLSSLRGQGQLELLTYKQNLGNGEVLLQPQTMPFQVALQNGLRFRLENRAGALRFANDTWSGQLGLAYTAFNQAGTATTRVSGALGNPKLNLETTGLLQLRGSGNLDKAQASGRLALQPLLASLPKELQTGVKAGAAKLEASWNAGILGFKTSLENTQLDQQAVRLNLVGQLKNTVWNAKGDVATGSSLSSFEVSNTGLKAQKLDLDLRLARLFALDFSGRIGGQFELPMFDLSKLEADLNIQEAHGFGLSANGALQASHGSITTTLKGFTPLNLDYSISGAVYPNLNAALELGQLTGRVTGSQLETNKRVLDLNLRGLYLEKNSKLSAAIRGDDFQANATWDAATLVATGQISDLSATGTLEIPDLQGIAGLAGSAKAKLEYSKNTLSITDIAAEAAGFKATGSAKYADEALQLEQFKVLGTDIVASGSGQIFPKLELLGTAKTTFNFAPTDLTWVASGTLEKPRVSAKGVLQEASLGLIAPNTGLEATFDGQNWRVQLAGQALSGVLEGGLSFVSGVNLRLNAPIVFEENRLQANGNLAWNNKTGFSGGLNVLGQLFGQAGGLRILGRNELEISSTWRDLNLKATLPSQIGLQLEAKLELQRVDLGAFYGKPKVIWLEGQGNATGQWTNPELLFTGLIASADQVLDSSLKATYKDNNANLTLEGLALNAQGTWNTGTWKVSSTTKNLSLKTYLPENLLPKELEQVLVSGAFEASGEGSRWVVSSPNLDVVTTVETLGKARVQGSAKLSPDLLETNLKLQTLNGSSQIKAALTNPLETGKAQLTLQAELQKLEATQLETLGVKGLVSGKINLTGALLEPEVSANLQVLNAGLQSETWFVSSNVEASGHLLNPLLNGKAFLSGTGAGSFTWRAAEVLSDAPRVMFNGLAELPIAQIKGQLEGALPKLQGQLEVKAAQLPEVLQISSSGDGAYKISSPELANGVLSLKAQDSWLESALSGLVRVSGNTDSFIPSVSALVGGDVVLTGSLQKPVVKLENTQLTRADATVLSQGSVYPTLDLQGTAESRFEFAPAKLEYNLTGTFEKPDLRVAGVLGTAQIGLIAPDTQVKASFDGQNWRLDLVGEALSGVLEGKLLSPTRANLKFNAPIIYADTRLTTLGRLTWDETQGFAGDLSATGLLFGQDSQLELVGKNNLEANLRWKKGGLRALLPNPSSEKLMATWSFDQFDLGAWWQKPDQLLINGDGKALGTWNKPELVFDGSLLSADATLNSKIKATYQENVVTAQVNGEKTKLEGRYENGTWQAKGSLEQVSLAALLPGLVKTLRTSLEFQASGTPKGLFVRVTGLETNGELETIGTFKASGAAELQAEYSQTGLEGNLELDNLVIEALDGRAKLSGKLDRLNTAPALFVNLENLNLEPFGVTGRLSGELDLAGKLSNPSVSGDLRGFDLGLKNESWSADATFAISRALLNPELSGSADFKGTASGRINLGLSEIFSNRPNLAVSGEAKLPFLRAKGSLAGQFPDLQGVLDLTLPTAPVALRQVKLEGVKGNSLVVTVQDVLQGQLELVPNQTLFGTGLRGKFVVNALLDTALEGLLNGTNGLLNAEVLVAGSLDNPSARLLGTLKNTVFNGVQLADAAVDVQYQNGFSGFLKFKNGQLKLEANTLSAANVPLEIAGVKAAVSATGRIAPLDLNFSSLISGNAAGTLEGRFVNQQLGLKLDLLSSGVRAIGTAGTNQTGWTGQINLSGLPKAAPISGKSLLGTAQFLISGALDAPVVKGTGDAYGAKFILNSNLNPLSANLQLLELGSGTVRLENNLLSGKLQYQDDALLLGLGLTGSLSIPTANLSAKVNDLSANGKVKWEANDLSAALDLTDGTQKGRFIFDNKRVLGAVENLSLASTGLAGYAGKLNISADLRQDSKSDFGWQGLSNITWQDLKTPLEVPTLGWKIDGSGRAKLSTDPVQVQLEYKGTPGVASGDLQFIKGLWQGDLNLDLQGAEGKGAVKGTVRADEKGITGDLTAQNLPVSYSGVRAVVSGKMDLDGDSFRLLGNGKALGGDIRLSGNGGLSDLIPLLETYTKTQPGDQPLDLTASVFTVRLQDLAQIRAAAPYLTGRVNGSLKIVGDAIGFQLNLPEISLPDQAGKKIIMAANINGTSAGNLIRYSGTFFDTRNPNPDPNAITLTGIGKSNFSGRFNGKVATGQLELRRAPLHALAASVLGEMPGTALATGFARYEIPVNDLLASTIKMDFVPLEVSGGGDLLRGKGRLIYSNGNLQFDDLILRGKGEWRINGDYAKEKVDLAMSFKNTVFTPILDLLPQIRDYDPRATGSLDLQLSGQYGKPDAKVSLKNLSASISGIQLTAKELLGSLEKGALQIRGTLTSDDSLGATLDTTANAKLVSYTPVQLEDLEALATGSLNIKPIGLIEKIKARIYGDSGGFKLEMTGKKGGDVAIRGDISPRIKLKLEGKALVMPIPDYFVADSLLDANLSFDGDGGRFYDVAGQLNIARLQAQLQQGSSSSKPATKPSADTRPNPFLQQVRFRGIEVIAPQGLRVSESFTTLEAGGKLVITGTMANPELSGALEAVGGSGGRGTVRLGINSYTIQTAVATFSPIEGIFPSIEIKSKGEVKATCTTSSTPPESKLELIPIELTIQVRWVSDPKNPSSKRIDIQPTVAGNCPNNYKELGAAELYSLVTLGSSSANLLGGLAQQSLDTVLSVFILGELSRQIKAATGIDIDFRSNLIEVVAQNISDSAAKAAINFTLNFGIDLSRAVRLNVQLNNNRVYTDPNSKNLSQLLGGAINLNWQSDDGRFGIRLGTPFFFPNPQQQLSNVFDVIQPEAQFTFNLSNAFGFAFTTSIPAANNFRVAFGVRLRF
jgi:hypothetical protein